MLTVWSTAPSQKSSRVNLSILAIDHVRRHPCCRWTVLSTIYVVKEFLDFNYMVSNDRFLKTSGPSWICIAVSFSLSTSFTLTIRQHGLMAGVFDNHNHREVVRKTHRCCFLGNGSTCAFSAHRWFRTREAPLRIQSRLSEIIQFKCQ